MSAWTFGHLVSKDLKMKGIPKMETPTSEQIQKLLAENAQLLKVIQDFQSKGKGRECFQFQQVLHRNLMYLASLADATQNGSPSLSSRGSSTQGEQKAAAPQSKRGTEPTSGLQLGAGSNSLNQPGPSRSQGGPHLVLVQENEASGGQFESPETQNLELLYQLPFQECMEGIPGYEEFQEFFQAPGQELSVVSASKTSGNPVMSDYQQQLLQPELFQFQQPSLMLLQQPELSPGPAILNTPRRECVNVNLDETGLNTPRRLESLHDNAPRFPWSPAVFDDFALFGEGSLQAEEFRVDSALLMTPDSESHEGTQGWSNAPRQQLP